MKEVNSEGIRKEDRSDDVDVNPLASSPHNANPLHEGGSAKGKGVMRDTSEKISEPTLQLVEHPTDNVEDNSHISSDDSNGEGTKYEYKTVSIKKETYKILAQLKIDEDLDTFTDAVEFALGNLKKNKKEDKDGRT